MTDARRRRRRRLGPERAGGGDRARASAGRSVLVLEAAPTIGGGTRTAELTLPGFRHDVCSAIHPLALASPFLREAAAGASTGSSSSIRRCRSPTRSTTARAVVLRPLGRRRPRRGLGARAARLPAAHASRSSTRCGRAGARAARPAAAAAPPARRWRASAWPALRSATGLARLALRGRARARAARRAAPRTRCCRSTQPRDRGVRARAALLAPRASAGRWPRGGSQAIADALASPAAVARRRDRDRTARCESLDELAGARARAVRRDAAPARSRSPATALPGALRRRARALPLRAGRVQARLGARRRRSRGRAERAARAGTVHLGGTLEEIAAAERGGRAGRAPRAALRAASRSRACSTRRRAPAGQAHGLGLLPRARTARRVDMTAAIEAQIERFAPGFRDLRRARAARWARPTCEAHNPNYVGGDINGGLADLRQLFAAAGRPRRSRTRPRTRACSSARRRRRPAAACTGCAAGTRRALRSRASSGRKGCQPGRSTPCRMHNPRRRCRCRASTVEWRSSPARPAASAAASRTRLPRWAAGSRESTFGSTRLRATPRSPGT